MDVGYFHTQFMTILGIGLIVLQVQLATVSGTVTRPGGSEPLAAATVTLNPVKAAENARIPTATTEDDGRFTLRDIEPGDYRLTVQSPRYGTVMYGQRKPDGPGAILSIAADRRIPELRVSMFPTAAIAGRVSGRDGEPVVNANVQAMTYVYQGGRKTLVPVQATTTDDRGEFRLFWLAGGKYVVAAAPRHTPAGTGTSRPVRPGELDRLPQEAELMRDYFMLSPLLIASLAESTIVKRILDDGTVQDESWMPVYYPATTDRAQASLLEVAPGAALSGINITLGPSPVQQVRGRVVGFPRGGQATVALTGADPGSTGRLVSKGASTIDGSFEFTGVLPGTYYLVAQERSGLVSAPIAVQVGNRDIDNLSIGIAPGIGLSGRIRVEGVSQNPGEPDPLVGVQVFPRPEIDGMTIGSLGSPTRLGGTLSWTNLPPGDYQFHIIQNPATQNPPQPSWKPLYLKSMRLGQMDAMGTVRISAGTTDVLEIVLTTEAGSIEGSAAANATVVLVPAARKRMTLYKTVVTASDGRFAFQDVPPGDYKLFAWDDVETGAWQNAEFIREHESKGRAVRISEKSKEDVQLTVISRP
jgi:5-hydroxyisourate hydrolase-like protein (transthyretin family)